MPREWPRGLYAVSCVVLEGVVHGAVVTRAASAWILPHVRFAHKQHAPDLRRQHGHVSDIYRYIYICSSIQVSSPGQEVQCLRIGICGPLWPVGFLQPMCSLAEVLVPALHQRCPTSRRYLQPPTRVQCGCGCWWLEPGGASGWLPQRPRQCSSKTLSQRAAEVAHSGSSPPCTHRIQLVPACIH